MSLPAGLSAPTFSRLTIAQPAAGADWSYTVPAGTWLKLLSGLVTLTCSATVAQRFPGHIAKDAGAVTLARFEYNVNAVTNPKANSVVVIGLGSSHYWQWAGQIQLIIPPLVFGPGYTLGSVSPNLQAGDQYSSIQLWVATWSALPFLDAYGPRSRSR